MVSGFVCSSFLSSFEGLFLVSCLAFLFHLCSIVELSAVCSFCVLFSLCQCVFCFFVTEHRFPFGVWIASLCILCNSFNIVLDWPQMCWAQKKMGANVYSAQSSCINTYIYSVLHDLPSSHSLTFPFTVFHQIKYSLLSYLWSKWTFLEIYF